MFQATILGRFVKNPDGKQIKKNNKIHNKCEFTLIAKNKSGESFIRCDAWGGLSNMILEKCQTGQLVFVQGDMVIPKFNKEKNVQYSPYLMVKDFQFAGYNKKQVLDQKYEEEANDYNKF